MDKLQQKKRQFVDKLRLQNYDLLRACLAECVGTAILIIFGCGVVAQVVLGNKGQGDFGQFLSISLGSGIALAISVLFAGKSGSGHVNPALSLAFAMVGRLPWIRVVPYMLAQLIGSMLGAFALYGVYYEKINEFARVNDNGFYLVNTTGSVFVTNPWASTTTCFLDQLMGTALLAASILAVTDHNGWRMPNYVYPLYLFMVLFGITSCFAINAGAALNPARDFGPRIVIAICGWGVEAFKAGNYFFWIPIVGPFLGAMIGAVLYELTLGIHMTRSESDLLHGLIEQRTPI